MSAAIAAFTQAYANRLANHGKSIGAAAGSYRVTDEGAAADIGNVSV